MRGRNRMIKIVCGFIVGFVLSAMMINGSRADVTLTKGQTLYVPAYSHVYIGDRALPLNLATTLSIRNTDSSNSITLISADYRNSNGELVKRMIQKPVTLGPLATTSIFVRERDTSGGFGASFIVRWRAEKEVNAPLVESVMIGSYSGQGISFVGSSREIR